MAVGCYAHIRAVCSTYEAWTPVYPAEYGEGFTRFGLDNVQIDDTGVVRATDVTYGAGGAPATFVPSGGQGPDEVISEAQSMRDYLVSRGVSPDRIVLEDRSSTTSENMEFSRKVIEEHAGRDVGELLVGFSTTNHHVFRGYVFAHRAGMAVQGMGSRTRAYFWPNAFLREFAGLLASRWKGILVTYVAIGSVYALAGYVLLLMGQASAVFVG